MSDVILSVENVSKLYRLGTVGTGTFGGDVQRFLKTKILGQEDPFLKVGQINDRTSKEKAEFVWALRDINFEVKRGEVLGIIGKNGAGKSTLLKLLSRITSPTTGSIKSAGRMASLLEVGTGFHPELTGRENIFLNGAILGMTKKEIQNKFDEIVDFSGCELYIDTPTKRYSSGMTVRLGFAVAAFLDPEILVVDEVLAVGDAEFQKKAIGKMKEVTSGGGRTVLFVSHNMASINALCSRAIFMQNGEVALDGFTEDVVTQYLSINNVNAPKRHIFIFESEHGKNAQIERVELLNLTRGNTGVIDVFDKLAIDIVFNVNTNLKGVTPILEILKGEDCILNSFLSDFKESTLDLLEKGNYSYRVTLPFYLKKGNYTVNVRIGKVLVSDVDFVIGALSFDVEELSFDPTKKSYSSIRKGIMVNTLEWVKI
jgi:lipopolysaccharide transport system ATP-binding protein